MLFGDKRRMRELEAQNASLKMAVEALDRRIKGLIKEDSELRKAIEDVAI